MTTAERLRNIVRPLACCCGLHAVMAGLPGPACRAAEAADSPAASQLTVTPGEGFTYLGKIAPRHARDIKASNWSVGAETMDRDYTVYKNWRQYLGPLGVKKARIQSGWAKTEKQKGKYDWAWLDEIIPDMVDQGVEPWVCLCYGNPIYPGGGSTGLGGGLPGLPSSPEALKAWDAFVEAFVNRYKKYVDEWELWNEPHADGGKGTMQYAKFAARTAELVRRCQPKARLIFAAGGAFDVVFVRDVLTWLRDQGKLSLVNEIAYHPYAYAYNPDDKYDKVKKLREIVRSFSDEI
ncbi:MAG: beta-galactosidase, partial [Phycisphaerae bacterium]|nr:beta-galactosidase [Phycisphaerae bacterium]